MEFISEMYDEFDCNVFAAVAHNLLTDLIYWQEF